MSRWWVSVVLTLCVFYGIQETTGEVGGRPVNQVQQNFGPDGEEVESHSVKKNETQRYALFKFQFHHVEIPYVICLWILLASIAKIGEYLKRKMYLKKKKNIKIKYSESQSEFLCSCSFYFRLNKFRFKHGILQLLSKSTIMDAK